MASRSGSSVDDLALLIRSRYAAIAVDTFEEQRLIEVVERVAAGLGVPVFTWSRTRGLSRTDSGGAAYDTAEPEKVLKHLEALDIDGIFVLADFQPYLEDPLVVRRLREVARKFTGPRRAILLAGTAVELPAELQRTIVPFRFELPSEDELRAELKQTLAEYQASANAIDELPPELLRKGRFDELFFVDLPGAEARARILELHLARRERDPGAFALDSLAAAADGFSGAELEQAVVAGLYTAFHAGEDLSTEILLNELAATVPLSVTMAEKVAALRAWAQGRAVPAS